MGDNRWLKNSFVYLIILVAALALFFNYFNTGTGGASPMGIYEVLAQAKAGSISKIVTQSGSDELVVTTRDNKQFRSRLETGDTITSLLLRAGVSPEDANNLVVQVDAAPAWAVC